MKLQGDKKTMMQQARTAEAKMKYAWDITAEQDLTAAQLKAANQISEIISHGGTIGELKQKIRLVKFPIK